MHPLIEILIVVGGAYGFFVAFALLSADRVIFRARRPGYRDGARCHLVKKTVWKWGKKRTKWVQVCRKSHGHRHH